MATNSRVVMAETRDELLRGLGALSPVAEELMAMMEADPLGVVGRFKAGWRVMRPRVDGPRQYLRGTITKVSPAGYVLLTWDDGASGYLGPVTAAEELVVVWGPDAEPRHLLDARGCCRWCGAPLPTTEIAGAACPMATRAEA
jgi:hypothetical protein